MKHVLLVVAVTAITAGALWSCGQSRNDAPTTRLAEPTDVIDQDLMLPLLQAKNFHHKAKVYRSDGNTTAAIASVREILSLRFPPNAPEADDVRADARAMLAKLLVDQNQLDEAMRVVDEGLAQSSRDSFFIANLYTVRGEVHQKRAEQLDDGDAASKTRAVEERHAAIADLDRSIAIDKKLMEKQ
jgi:tetratricopeptide (TPR) repeat protein